MDALIRLIAICNTFKQGKTSIVEFQKRIETIILPHECKYTLEKAQYNACNALEEILHCYANSQKEYADKVAEMLIQTTLLEQNRLKTIKK